MSCIVTRDTLLKNLRPSQLRKLTISLNSREKFKAFSSFIKRQDGRYLLEPFEVEASALERSPAEAIIRTWIYENPTINDLLNVLEEAELYQERNIVLTDLLHESPSRLPVEIQTYGDEATPLKSDELPPPPVGNYVYDSNTATRMVSNELYVSTDTQIEQPDVKAQNFSVVDKEFSYESILSATDNFNMNTRKLGKGGFGHVFYGALTGFPPLAIKRLDISQPHKRENQEKQFKTELNILQRILHINVVRLFGYSTNGPHWCLVYEYMPNGSLEERLACKLRHAQESPLSVHQRVHIIHGSATGLVYLHTQNLVHRDVKSANILLDDNFEAKVGDCGLVRAVSDPHLTHDTTGVIIGTRGYMPIEYMRSGHVSKKMDAYAFGVVMAEVLTGQPPHNPFLIDKLMNEYLKLEDFLKVIDNRGGQWPRGIAEEGHEVIQKLILDDKHKRVTIEECLPKLAVWDDKFIEYETD